MHRVVETFLSKFSGARAVAVTVEQQHLALFFFFKRLEVFRMYCEVWLSDKKLRHRRGEKIVTVGYLSFSFRRQYLESSCFSVTKYMYCTRFAHKNKKYT